MHPGSCDEAIQTLMLCSNLANRSIEACCILDIDLAVMNRASKLADPLFGFVVFMSGLWQAVDTIHWDLVNSLVYTNG